MSRFRSTVCVRPRRVGPAVSRTQQPAASTGHLSPVPDSSGKQRPFRFPCDRAGRRPLFPASDSQAAASTLSPQIRTIFSDKSLMVPLPRGVAINTLLDPGKLARWIQIALVDSDKFAKFGIPEFHAAPHTAPDGGGARGAVYFCRVRRRRAGCRVRRRRAGCRVRRLRAGCRVLLYQRLPGGRAPPARSRPGRPTEGPNRRALRRPPAPAGRDTRVGACRTGPGRAGLSESGRAGSGLGS